MTKFKFAPAGRVRLWLSVYEKACPVDVLWTRLMYTQFAPREGDMLHLWTDENGEDDGQWFVRRHYWNHNGLYNCELTYMVVDPTESIVYDQNKPHYSRAWYTHVAGRPEPNLRRAGWITYDEYRALSVDQRS